MPNRGRVTDAIVGTGNSRSVSSRARGRRWERFQEVFPDISGMRILDLGGTPAYWRAAPVQPAHVTTINLDEHAADEPWITHLVGDACAPPVALDFDLVVSNSLLEHLGGHGNRQRFADVVHAAADQHWVQTPYRYFPVEPHWMFPGLQFLPFPARVAVTKAWPLGHRHTDDTSVAVASVHEVDLIGITQLRSYFPTSAVWIERFAGVPKSIVAIKSRTA